MPSSQIAYGLKSLFQNNSRKEPRQSRLCLNLYQFQSLRRLRFLAQGRNITRDDASPYRPLKGSLLPTYQISSLTGLAQTHPYPAPHGVLHSLIILTAAASSPASTLGGDPVTWRQLDSYKSFEMKIDFYWSKSLLSQIFFLTRLSFRVWIIPFRSFTVMPHWNFVSP